MKWMLYLLLILQCIKADTTEQNFGILTEGLNYIQNKDAKIAIKLWISDMSKAADIHDLKVHYYHNENKVFKEFKTGKITYLALNTLYYLQNRDYLTPMIKSIYAFTLTNKPQISYLLVCKKNQKIQSIKDLKHKRIGMQRLDYTEELYLNHLLLEKKLPNSKYFFRKTIKYESATKPLMKLFFNKVDACIIPDHKWKLACEMNPQIKKKLKILNKSPEIFIPAISIISKNIDPKIEIAHTTYAQNLHKNIRGKQILTLLKSNSYVSINQQILQPLIDYYASFLKYSKSKNGK